MVRRGSWPYSCVVVVAFSPDRFLRFCVLDFIEDKICAGVRAAS